MSAVLPRPVRVLRAAATVAAVALAAWAVPAAAAPATGAVADDGARVVRETVVDERTIDLEIASPALGATASVRLLLPPRWHAEPERDWPVLYLLHGCCAEADYRSWTEFTDAEQFLADKDVLAVLPSDGVAGMYSAWWNQGESRKPDWETFHVTEVRQIVERGYRAGTERAAAGLSIGGYGAMAYAFRHPGMFGAAASFSGSVDILHGLAPSGIKGVLSGVGFDPHDLWGDEWVNRPLWMEHNPADHVTDLRGVGLYVSAGNGTAGPLDAPDEEYDPHEAVSLASSRSFTDRLRSQGIPVTTNYYGNGTHAWPYWERELHAAWPVLAKGLGLR